MLGNNRIPQSYISDELRENLSEAALKWVLECGRRGIVLLGTPIGSHEFTIQAIRERIHKVKAFTACLALKWKIGRDTALDVNHCRPSCLTRLPPLQVMYLVWPTTGT